MKAYKNAKKEPIKPTHLSLSDEDVGALSGAGLGFLPRGFGGGFSAWRMTQKEKCPLIF